MIYIKLLNIVLRGFYICFIMCLTSCIEDYEISNMTIASVTIKKEGYKCYFVKLEDEKSWSIFYDTIEGFQHIEGHEYFINITKTEIKNPPQDASSYHYKLNYIISDVKKESEGIPSYWN